MAISQLRVVLFLYLAFTTSSMNTEHKVQVRRARCEYLQEQCIIYRARPLGLKRWWENGHLSPFDTDTMRSLDKTLVSSTNLAAFAAFVAFAADSSNRGPRSDDMLHALIRPSMCADIRTKPVRGVPIGFSAFSLHPTCFSQATSPDGEMSIIYTCRLRVLEDTHKIANYFVPRLGKWTEAQNATSLSG